ncbi:MAG: chromosomal replication initiator protein DnaA [Dehalococcoidales bacterium]
MEGSSAKEIWEATLGELQIQVSKPNYRTWLEKTVGLSYQGNQFVIGVPNTFVAEYLDQNQRSLIEKTLIGLTRRDIKIQFHVDSAEQNSLASYRNQGRIPSAQQTSLPLFNPKYTFDSFIVGSCNRLAYAAALKVAENPGQSYNPLFIYGGVGLGKTHLLHAIGHAALAQNMQALYVSAEQFTNEFTNAIRERKTQEFHHKYRNVDILLVDDIQFFCGKVQTEETFFHTFNELHNANRQIAITCDRAPKYMSLLQDRLRSRFEGGLVADIQPPDFETCLAVLHAKAEQKGVNVAPDVLEFIAQRIHQNIRELEGSLNRVIAYARLIRGLLTTELAAQALQDIADKKPKNNSITPHLIMEAVVDTFQLTPQQLKSQKRDKETALARQVAMYLLREEASWSLTQIGKELGGRGPATVSHAYEKIANDINNSPYLRHKISDIQQKIDSKQKGWNY